MRVFRFLVLATATVGGVLLGTSRAEAHALFIKVEPATDPVKVLAYYEEDIPAESADVTVTDADGNVVVSGKTNDRGEWAFERPTKPGTYTVTVKQTGHRAKDVFTVAEAAEGAGAEADQPAPTGRRLNRWVGLSLGVAGLLGISGVSWLLRRRGRKLE
jgi:nickel transport protein